MQTQQNRQAKQQDKHEKQGEWLVRSNNSQIHDEEEKGRKQCRDSLDERRGRGTLGAAAAALPPLSPYKEHRTTDTHSKQQHIRSPYHSRTVKHESSHCGRGRNGESGIGTELQPLTR